MGTVNEDVRVRIYADGAQDVARKLGALESKVEKIGKEAKKAGRDMSGLGNILKGVAAAAAGVGIANVVKDTLQFDSALGQLQADMGLSNAQALALRDRMLQLSASYGTTKEEILGAYQTFQGFAGDIDKYKGTMDALVMTHKATGTSLEDLAKLQATLTDSLLMSPEAAMEGIAALRAYANAGTIELRNMASELPQIFGVSASLGFTGQRGIQQMGTALGVAGQAFGGRAEEARTSINSLLVEMQKKSKDFKKTLGIEIFNKDGTMRDLTIIMDEIAKKTGFGTTRGKTGLVNFFGESSIKTVQTWMTMMKSGKAKVIHELGMKGAFTDIEKAYKSRMEGVAKEAEILQGMLANVNSGLATLSKALVGFVAENPALSAALGVGALAAPVAAKGITAAAGGIRAAAAAGGAMSALETATMWTAGPALAGLAGAAFGHFIVDEWLGKKLTTGGKSFSSAFADGAVDPAKQASISARYADQAKKAYAIEQVRQMASIEAGGKNLGGVDAIVAAAVKAQGLQGNQDVINELRNIAAEIKASKPSVVVKPAGGVDKLDARSKRTKQ
jgi:hypothetical protein